METKVEEETEPLIESTSLAAKEKKKTIAATVPGSYIVTYKNKTKAMDSATLLHNIKMMSGLSEDQLKALKQDPDVESVEPDYIVSVVPINPTRVDASVSKDVSAMATIVPWQVSRLGCTTSPSWSGASDMKTECWVVDTGVDVSSGLNVVESKTFVSGGTATLDPNGHGTHVAGIIGAPKTGLISGVARGIKIKSVQVLDQNGSGSFSGVIQGLNYVLQRAVKPAIVNLSLGAYVGTTALNALDRAVISLINAGIPVVMAAGNDGVNAAYSSPAHTALYNSGAIVAAAYSEPGPSTKTSQPTNYPNRMASWSNYGSSVTMQAPGVSILSLAPTYPTQLNGNQSNPSGLLILSGTSMASPALAGACALYMQTHISAKPAAIRSAVFNSSRSASLGASPLNRPVQNVVLGTTNVSAFARSF